MGESISLCEEVNVVDLVEELYRIKLDGNDFCDNECENVECIDVKSIVEFVNFDLVMSDSEVVCVEMGDSFVLVDVISNVVRSWWFILWRIFSIFMDDFIGDENEFNGVLDFLSKKNV